MAISALKKDNEAKGDQSPIKAKYEGWAKWPRT